MRTLLLSIVIVLFYGTTNAQQYAWAGQFSTTSSAGGSPASIITDTDGNVYSTGYFQGTVDFDPGPGVFSLASGSTSSRDGYVSKLDRNGNFTWAISFTGNGTAYCYSVTRDDSGYVYVAGGFIGTVDFDPGPAASNLTSFFQTDADPFICKLTSTGDFVWVKTIKAEESDGASGIVADDNGNTYTLLYLRNGVDIDPGPGIVNVNWGAYILKLDRNGNYVSNVQLVQTSTAVGLEICLKNGLLHGVYRTGSGPLVSTICKVDLDLNIIWQVVEGDGTDAKSITVDNAGNVIVSGQYSGTVDFDPGVGVDMHTAVSTGGTNDMFFTKLDANGNFQWARTPGTANEEVAYAVSAAPNGDIYVAGTVYFPIYLEAGNPASYLVPQSQDAFNAKFDGNGNFQWVIKTGDTGSDMASAMTTDDHGNVYTTGLFMGSPDFNPDPNVTDTLTSNTGNSTIFVAKYSEANRISGNIFVDGNNDGIYQAGEINVPYVLIKAVSGSTTTYGMTDAAGHYNLYTGGGTFTISVVSVPAYYNSPVSTHTVSFSTNNGNIDTLNDFPVRAISAVNDLSVNCYPLGRARPGRDFYVDVIYRNTGTTTLSGTVTLDHDALVNYQQSVPAASGYTNPQITWSYANLQPFETRSVRVLFSTSVNAVAGSTILLQTAGINPVPNDYTPSNNVYQDSIRVTGSYDPNVKTVMPAGPVSTAFIEADSSSLSYCIKFQNTGTDTAFVVSVTDTIQSTLDLASLKILGASHAFTIEIKPANVLKFTFNNILLPDSTTNEPLSHGFISYTIKPFDDLSIGTEIKNKAAIYFDLNVPVITNETVNMVANNIPVSLSAYDIVTGDCSKVIISWTTEAETGNSLFILEKNNNGSTWTQMTTITGTGNGGSTNHYSYTDESALNGMVNYRLKHISGNGAESILFDKSVTCDKINQVKIYPNPVSDILIIETGSAFEYFLSDSKGSVIKRGNGPGTMLSLEIKGFNKGVYFLVIKTAEGISRHKVLVQ